MVFTYHTASTDMSTYLPQFVNNYWRASALWFTW